MKNGFAICALLGALALATAGCGKEETTFTEEEAGTVWPDGWERLKIKGSLGGWYSDIEIDSMGHFKASTNPCWQEQWGALKDRDAWNKIVTTMNASIRAQRLLEPSCVEQTTVDQYRIDDVVAVTWPDKKSVEVFTSRGSEICTTFSTSALMKDLEAGLIQLAREAAREGCYRDRN